MPTSTTLPSLSLTLSLVVCALTSACAARTTAQRGTVIAPHAPSGDGQPLGAGQRAEIHFGAGTSAGKDDVENDATAVTRQDGGVAMLWSVGPNRDLGFVADAAWAPTDTFLSGDDASGAPSKLAMAGGLAFRQSIRWSDRFRLGFGGEVGLTSQPVAHGTTVERDTGLLLRVGLVPSVRLAPATAFAVVGVATEPHVPAVVQSGSEGIRTSLAASVGLGASIDVGDRAHLGVRATQSGGSAGSYSRVELTASFDFGHDVKPR